MRPTSSLLAPSYERTEAEGPERPVWDLPAQDRTSYELGLCLQKQTGGIPDTVSGWLALQASHPRLLPKWWRTKTPAIARATASGR